MSMASTLFKNNEIKSYLSWKNPIAIVDRCNKIIIIVITDMKVSYRCEIVAIKQVLINAIMLSNCLNMSAG